MENHSEVSQTMEALHAKVARLVLLLEEAGDQGDPLLPLASSLLDDIDALRALHLRVVMRSHASA